MFSWNRLTAEGRRGFIHGPDLGTHGTRITGHYIHSETVLRECFLPQCDIYASETECMRGNWTNPSNLIGLAWLSKYITKLLVLQQAIYYRLLSQNCPQTISLLLGSLYCGREGLSEPQWCIILEVHGERKSMNVNVSIISSHRTEKFIHGLRQQAFRIP